MITIELPPGVVNVRSKKAKTASWRETNLVRWEDKTMHPVGGWAAVDFDAFPSRLRAIHKWIANDGAVYVAYLCEEHCFVDIAGVLTDISPTPAITAPLTGNFAFGGYGDGDYGALLYGTPRAAFPRLATFTPCYTLDNWGEDLLAMTSADGRLLRWSPSTPGDDLEIVPNAPENNRSFQVTPERHVMVFGADGEAWVFAWSDQEDIEDWTPGTTSKAGSLPVEPRAPIVAHRKMVGGTAIVTNREVGMIRWVGLPLVYAYERVTEVPTPLSAASITEIPDGVIWPSTSGFWIFNGVSIAPLPCDIWDWIVDQINMSASKYTSAIVNVSVYDEVWWFFATGDDDTAQNDRYVAFNYRSKIWYMGKLARTCGLSYPNDVYPIMSDGTTLYKHEFELSYPNAEELPWAETHTMNIVGGSNKFTIKQMLPEITGDYESVIFKFAKSNNPTQGPETYSDEKTVRSNGYVDVRETAFNFRMRVEGNIPGDWSLGPTQVDVIARGNK